MPYRVTHVFPPEDGVAWRRPSSQNTGSTAAKLKTNEFENTNTSGKVCSSAPAHPRTGTPWCGRSNTTNRSYSAKLTLSSQMRPGRPLFFGDTTFKRGRITPSEINLVRSHAPPFKLPCTLIYAPHMDKPDEEINSQPVLLPRPLLSLKKRPPDEFELSDGPCALL